MVTLCNVQCLRQILLGEDCFVTLCITPSTYCPKQSASDKQAQPSHRLAPFAC